MLGLQPFGKCKIEIFAAIARKAVQISEQELGNTLVGVIFKYDFRPFREVRKHYFGCGNTFVVSDFGHNSNIKSLALLNNPWVECIFLPLSGKSFVFFYENAMAKGDKSAFIWFSLKIQMLFLDLYSSINGDQSGEFSNARLRSENLESLVKEAFHCSQNLSPSA